MGVQRVPDKDLSLEDAQRFLEAGYSRRSAVYGTASEKMPDLFQAQTVKFKHELSHKLHKDAHIRHANI